MTAAKLICKQKHRVRDVTDDRPVELMSMTFQIQMHFQRKKNTAVKLFISPTTEPLSPNDMICQFLFMY
jgi:hypothetical protein